MPASGEYRIHWWWNAWACLRLTREDHNSCLTQHCKELCRKNESSKRIERFASKINQEDCSKKAPIERLHMIMKLENSYERQETKKKWMRNKIYSPSRCLQRQHKAMPNDGQEMNFSRCDSLRRKGKRCSVTFRRLPANYFDYLFRSMLIKTRKWITTLWKLIGFVHRCRVDVCDFWLFEDSMLFSNGWQIHSEWQISTFMEEEKVFCGFCGQLVDEVRINWNCARWNQPRMTKTHDRYFLKLSSKFFNPLFQIDCDNFSI